MLDLIRLSVDADGHVVGVLNFWLLLGLLAAAILFVFINPRYRRAIFRPEYEVNEVELGIGNNKLRLKPNNEDLQVAYRLWVELRTRKLGLPFDEEHDVIVEVYNSWYEFFRLTRDLIKAIPITKIQGHRSTQDLVGIAIDILNKNIRPHLTKWQARFRRWYETESGRPENHSISSQELQRRFPEYALLVADLKATNARLVAYGNLLSDLLGADLDRRKTSRK